MIRDSSFSLSGRGGGGSGGSSLSIYENINRTHEQSSLVQLTVEFDAGTG